MAVIAAGIAGCSRPEPVKTITENDRSVPATILVVAESEVPEIFEATGTVKAQFNADLSSKVMGRVVSVVAHEGDKIKRGEVLVSIDARELQSAVSIADANYQASVVGVGSARTAAEMEERTSNARIVQAELQVQQASAALSVAEARRDLVLAGPRTQEITQARIAVNLAESGVNLAKRELERAASLVEVGAIARRELDRAQNRFDFAKAQLDSAVQSENIAKEGSRSQEIRAAQDSVSQAKAAVKQANSAVVQARAAAMLVNVRRKEIDVAAAVTKQTAAVAQSARVSLSYGIVSAPFDGRVVHRLADPGAMASPGVSLMRVEGGEYRFEAVVPEKLLRHLAPDSTATINIDACNRPAMKSRVVEIVPQGDASSHSFVVKFSIGYGADIKSGIFGRANINIGTTRRALIPTNATWVREGLNYVYAVDHDARARIRIITVGREDNGEVEVLSGIGKGDQIINGDRSAIVDGVKVTKK